MNQLYLIIINKSCYYYFFAIVFFDFGSKSSSLSDLEDSNCEKTEETAPTKAFCSAVRPLGPATTSSSPLNLEYRHCSNN